MSRRRATRKEHRDLIAASRPRYDEMLAAQEGVCAICGNPPKTRRLHIDHDHRTMTVRGLLCFRCNTGLRYWMSPVWLRATADYLEKDYSNKEEEAA